MESTRNDNTVILGFGVFGGSGVFWGVLGFRVFGGFGCLEVLWCLGVLGCCIVAKPKLNRKSEFFIIINNK